MSNTSIPRQKPQPDMTDDEKREHMAKAAGMHESQGPTPGKKNIYVCDKCFGHIVTRDAVEGVTPFMTMCKASPGCKGHMQSSMYRVWNQAMRASHEWYRPTGSEVAPMGAATIEHVKQGGLILRVLNHEPEEKRNPSS